MILIGVSVYPGAWAGACVTGTGGELRTSRGIGKCGDGERPGRDFNAAHRFPLGHCIVDEPRRVVSRDLCGNSVGIFFHGWAFGVRVGIVLERGLEVKGKRGRDVRSHFKYRTWAQMRRVANELWLCPQSRHGYRLDLERLGRGFPCR